MAKKSYAEKPPLRYSLQYYAWREAVKSGDDIRIAKAARDHNRYLKMGHDGTSG